MKLRRAIEKYGEPMSLPARGAWIEIMMEGYSIYRMLSDRAKDLKAKADAK